MLTDENKRAEYLIEHLQGFALGERVLTDEEVDTMTAELDQLLPDLPPV